MLQDATKRPYFRSGFHSKIGARKWVRQKPTLVSRQPNYAAKEKGREWQMAEETADDVRRTFPIDVIDSTSRASAAAARLPTEVWVVGGRRGVPPLFMCLCESVGLGAHAAQRQSCPPIIDRPARQVAATCCCCCSCCDFHHYRPFRRNPYRAVLPSPLRCTPS